MAPYAPGKTDSKRLWERARARIAAGELPRTAAARLYAGFGGNEPCAVCGQPISPQQTTYELEFIRGADGKPLSFHLACHAAWQLELDPESAAWVPR